MTDDTLLDNIQPDPADFTPLIALLESRLNNGLPVSEYELLSWLKSPQQGVFDANALQDSLLLFRCHFIVMHCLYRLREQWHGQQQALLHISALRIQRLPWQSAQGHEVAEADPLASYYLDLSGLATGRETVDALLNSFWQQMLTPAALEQDLQVLQLDAGASQSQIRQQYRRLAMEHHPDRGGDEATFCRIQSAYQRLKNRAL